MPTSGLELVALLLIFMVIFLSRTKVSLEQFISVPHPTGSQVYARKLFRRLAFASTIQVLLGIFVEVGILVIFFSHVTHIIGAYRFTLSNPDIRCSLCVLIYICVIGAFVYSLTMLVALRNKLQR